MEIDPKKIERLRAMSEEELATLIRQSAKKMGMGSVRANLFAAYAPKIKRKLEHLTDADLAQAVEKIGADKVEKLLEQIE